MTIQLATRLTGLTVIATASRPETIAWVRKLGAKHVANHSKPIDEAIKAIGFDGVDYIAAITTTSGSGPSIVNALNPQGHITLIDNFDESIMPFKAKEHYDFLGDDVYPLIFSNSRHGRSAPAPMRSVGTDRCGRAQVYNDEELGTDHYRKSPASPPDRRKRSGDRQDRFGRILTASAFS